jgi:uncharacterized metal-binding protein
MNSAFSSILKHRAIDHHPYEIVAILTASFILALSKVDEGIHRLLAHGWNCKKDQLELKLPCYKYSDTASLFAVVRI